MFAIIIDVSEEVLLIGKLLVMLEVVKWLSEDSIVDAVLIFVTFVCLLPAEVYEHLLAIFNLLPMRSSAHHAAYELTVVTDSQVVFERVFGTRAKLAFVDSTRAFVLIFSIGEVGLVWERNTLRIRVY